MGGQWVSLAGPVLPRHFGDRRKRPLTRMNLGIRWAPGKRLAETAKIPLRYMESPAGLVILVHISPWEATVGLLEHSAKLLPLGGPLVLYGPYFQQGVETAPSNLAFDESLRARDSRWGPRQLEDVVALAESRGLGLEAVHSMPANNLTVILRLRG